MTNPKQVTTAAFPMVTDQWIFDLADRPDRFAADLELLYSKYSWRFPSSLIHISHDRAYPDCGPVQHTIPDTFWDIPGKNYYQFRGSFIYDTDRLEIVNRSIDHALCSIMRTEVEVAMFGSPIFDEFKTQAKYPYIIHRLSPEQLINCTLVCETVSVDQLPPTLCYFQNFPDEHRVALEETRVQLQHPESTNDNPCWNYISQRQVAYLMDKDANGDWRYQRIQWIRKVDAAVMPLHYMCNYLLSNPDLSKFG